MSLTGFATNADGKIVAILTSMGNNLSMGSEDLERQARITAGGSQTFSKDDLRKAAEGLLARLDPERPEHKNDRAAVRRVLDLLAA